MNQDYKFCSKSCFDNFPGGVSGQVAQAMWPDNENINNRANPAQFQPKLPTRAELGNNMFLEEGKKSNNCMNFPIFQWLHNNLSIKVHPKPIISISFPDSTQHSFDCDQ